MAREGWTLRSGDLVVLSPYRCENVLRFGDYTTDQLHVPPPACQPGLRAAVIRDVRTVQDDHQVAWSKASGLTDPVP